MDEISGPRILLRPATVDDVEALVAIRSTPEVYARWGPALPGDLAAWVSDTELHPFVIDDEDRRVIGAIHGRRNPTPTTGTPPSTHAPTGAGTEPRRSGRSSTT